MTPQKPGERQFKILYCSTALSFGGEQKLLGQILSHLNHEKFSSKVCSIRPYTHIDPPILASCSDINCLQAVGRFDIFKPINKLRHFLKMEKIDLIHTSIFGSELIVLLTSVITRIPVIAVLTTTYDRSTRLQANLSNRLRQSIKWWGICLLQGILSRIAKVKYIALSEEIKRSAQNNLHLPSNKVIVNPIGLKVDKFHSSKYSISYKENLKRTLGLLNAYPILINIARVSPVKGQRALLEIIPGVLSRFPNAKLLIVGDGPEYDELVNQVDNHGLKNYVSLLGRRDDVAELLTISDFFVFSSFYEGLPAAVIEAMLAGKAVIAFDILPLRELIENHISGVLIEKRNIGQFADEIIRLADNPEEAQRLGKAAKRIAKKKYDITINIKNLEEVYDSMISHKPSSPNK